MESPGVVGCKIDAYVQPVLEKIDQVRWNFFMKTGGRLGAKIRKTGAGQVENYITKDLISYRK